MHLRVVSYWDGVQTKIFVNPARSWLVRCTNAPTPGKLVLRIYPRVWGKIWRGSAAVMPSWLTVGVRTMPSCLIKNAGLIVSSNEVAAPG